VGGLAGLFPPDGRVGRRVQHVRQFPLNLQQAAFAHVEVSLIEWAVVALLLIQGVQVSEGGYFLAQGDQVSR